MKRWLASGVRHFYEFGEFRFDGDRRRLLRGDKLVALSPKAIDLLNIFVLNPGKVLERTALMEALWADTIVEDANLTVAISHLRKALGESRDSAEYIETIPRVGYRFVAELREVMEERTPLTTEKPRPVRAFIEERFVPETGVVSVVAPSAKIESGNGRTNGLPPGEPPVVASAVNREFRWTGGRTMALIALLALGVVGLQVYWRAAGRPQRSASTPQIKSIAVLPFQSLGQTGTKDDYLATGLADSLNTRLSRLKQFAVRPTSSVLRFRGGDQDAVAAGRELKVEGVIEGLIQHDNDRVRLTARLLRVSDGALIWTDSFDERFTSLFAVEDDISQHVVKALQLKLTTEEQRQFARRGTDNFDAFRAYLRGRYAWNKRNTDATKQAITFFQQATDLDPAYAAAYAGLADCYVALGDYGDASPGESFPLARGAAQRALEIEDSLAEAHASLAQTRFLYDWDWAGAEREYLRAIELKPNYATAHHWYGMFLAAMGRTDEAKREIKRAEDLDPLSLIIQANVGTIDYFARHYDHAIEQERKVLKANPNFAQAHRKLAFCLEAAGMEEEAVAEWLKVERQIGTSKEALASYASACAASGIRGYWLQAIEVEKKEAVGAAAALSSYYARLGQREEALLWFERAIDEHAPWLVYAKVTPVYDNLRGDPRFGTLLQRLGL